jgi:hypothetical protein
MSEIADAKQFERFADEPRARLPDGYAAPLKHYLTQGSLLPREAPVESVAGEKRA